MSHIEQIPPELTWRIRRQVLYPDQEFAKAILDQDDEGMHLGLFYENKFTYANLQHLSPTKRKVLGLNC
jgi:hypothetical protein